ncbi:MAG: hypothetical protein ABR600_08725 [Actinomycetota bacterium]
MGHRKLDIMEEKGFVILEPYQGDLDPSEWESLRYFDYKSGGDTNFAVLASATGEEETAPFWAHDKSDKDGVWTSNVEKAPTLRKWVENAGARFGRVRIIKLEPSTSLEEVIGRFLHPDDNNRLNPDGEGWVVRAWLNLTDDPDSFMVVRDVKDDPSTESRIPLPKGAQFVVDTERMFHAVYHPSTTPRYALITSFESGPELDTWIQANQR